MRRHEPTECPLSDQPPAIEANKKDLGGHAEMAEKAMHNAMEQIEQAAKFANEHHK